ncbi:MAG: hypothetical protein IKO48_01045 [Elusimicrobia bacterium]|nr:hypothetical protein [Elusimicrobiota bacterium]
MMDNENNIFRLAAVLYADSNYDGISTLGIRKKIIESVFIENLKKEISIHEIIDFIELNYNLIFSEQDVNSVLKKYSSDFYTSKKDNILFISIPQKRKNNILNKINNNIDYFIDIFIKDNKNKYIDIDIKDVIYKFLYNVFTTNINSFQKLITSKKNTELNNNYNCKDSEKILINNFLDWDNDDKNKAIFDIASYALEYCFLTNKKDSNALKLSSLNNKQFYIDTNIIYRALGINGVDRQKRCITFLQKFNECKNKLIISKHTDKEFKSTIDFHIKRIQNSLTTKINSKVFRNYKKFKYNYVKNDIFTFYHEWRINKNNTNLNIFHIHLLSLYDNLKKQFNISIDNDILNDKQLYIKQNILNNYVEEISNIKSTERDDYGDVKPDAQNILLIEEKRKSNKDNIFNTIYFLISADKLLQKWDSNRAYKNDVTPIVLLPSQWLSIILRYINRSKDDFKSFVAFLNLKMNDNVITGEQFQAILAGVSEVTTNIEQQTTFVKNFIDNDFKKQRIEPENIKETAKLYAKKELEKENEILKSNYEEVMKENKKLKLNENKNIEINQKQKTINMKLIKDNVSKDLLNWKIRGVVFSILVILFCVTSIVLLFYFRDWKYNYIYSFSDYLNKLCRNSVIIDKLIDMILTALFAVPMLSLKNLFWCRLFNKKFIKQKMQELEQNYNDKYNIVNKKSKLI